MGRSEVNRWPGVKTGRTSHQRGGIVGKKRIGESAGAGLQRIRRKASGGMKCSSLVKGKKEEEGIK